MHIHVSLKRFGSQPGAGYQQKLLPVDIPAPGIHSTPNVVYNHCGCHCAQPESRKAELCPIFEARERVLGCKLVAFLVAQLPDLLEDVGSAYAVERDEEGAKGRLNKLHNRDIRSSDM